MKLAALSRFRYNNDRQSHNNHLIICYVPLEIRVAGVRRAGGLIMLSYPSRHSFEAHSYIALLLVLIDSSCVRSVVSVVPPDHKLRHQ